MLHQKGGNGFGSRKGTFKNPITSIGKRKNRPKAFFLTHSQILNDPKLEPRRLDFSNDLERDGGKGMGQTRLAGRGSKNNNSINSWIDFKKERFADPPGYVTLYWQSTAIRQR